MEAYKLVVGRIFEASVCVTLYKCPWHPYIESLLTLWYHTYQPINFYLVDATLFCLRMATFQQASSIRPANHLTWKTLASSPGFHALCSWKPGDEARKTPQKQLPSFPQLKSTVVAPGRSLVPRLSGFTRNVTVVTSYVILRFVVHL